MAEVVTALPATFRGVRFRSRTEARWAVFMQSLGIEWHYEHEAYNLPSGNYLPDFWLPNIASSSGPFPESAGVFIEIKGENPDQRATKLLEELAEARNKRCFLVIGTPREYMDWATDYYGASHFMSHCKMTLICGARCGDQPYMWTRCWRCGEIGIEFDARSARVKHRWDCPIASGSHDREENIEDPRIIQAVQESRSWTPPEGRFVR